MAAGRESSLRLLKQGLGFIHNGNEAIDYSRLLRLFFWSLQGLQKLWLMEKTRPLLPAGVIAAGEGNAGTTKCCLSCFDLMQHIQWRHYYSHWY
jgi:hypothetical protein